MSVEQCQRNVNTLDKEIADLEKKKASEDKKAAEVRKKAANIKISSNASSSTVRSKLRQIESYETTARKAEEASAEYSKKIAEKKRKRNEAYLKLQKVEQSVKKKQDKALDSMKRAYERRIAELEKINIYEIESRVINSDISDDSEYDVFVSHAWEDKDSFVDEFVEELKGKGIDVWYDKTQMKWGDSMRQKIDDGLRKSKFGVVVLSPNYIAEGKYWTKAELDGLFQLESISVKRLLPIWHNLTKKQIIEFSPTIASRLAMNTASMTAEEIADELSRMLFMKAE